MNLRRRLVKTLHAWKLLRETRAATAVEYGLILALVVITLVMAVVAVAEATADVWNNVSDKVIGAS